MQGRNPTNVEKITESLTRAVTLLYIREYILERLGTNVKNVVMSLPRT